VRNATSAAFIAVLVILSACKHASPGLIREEWQTSNGTFSIRVTLYGEIDGGFVGGAYYKFASTGPGKSGWQEIMLFRHDDPVPILTTM
jgi:hypothetical protein